MGNQADEVQSHQAGSLNDPNWSGGGAGGWKRDVLELQTMEVMSDGAWLPQEASSVIHFLSEETRSDGRLAPLSHLRPV